MTALTAHAHEVRIIFGRLSSNSVCVCVCVFGIGSYTISQASLELSK